MSWLYRYSFEGRRKKAILGSYPDLTLRKAREKRDGLAAQVGSGKSPTMEAKQRRAGLSTNPPVKEFGEPVLQRAGNQALEEPECHSALPGQRDSSHSWGKGS